MENIDLGDYKVTSEVHVFSDCEPLKGEEESVVISNFNFTLPDKIKVSGSEKSQACSTIEKDEDGDPIISRKNEREDYSLAIKHHVNTSLDLVGLQVWRGALLLADFLLHAATDDKPGFKISEDDVLIELGAGTGLTSVVAGMVAKEVCSTDISKGNILSLIETNIKQNAHFLKDHKVEVEELDFYNQNYGENLVDKLERASIIIAADVVYHDDLTDAFLHTLKRIMSIGRQKTAFISLEKRFVFTVCDLDVCAPCYDYFYETLFKELNSFDIQELDTSKIPQYFCYERAKELVLIQVQTRT
nr:EOG090X0C5G [Macrothrix elegans]